MLKYCSLSIICHKFLYQIVSDWLAQADNSDSEQVPVPGLVEYIVKQLGLLDEGNEDSVAYLLVECSVATLAGAAVTVGVAYGLFKLWGYVRNGCRQPDPMTRTINLIEEARDRSHLGAFRSQAGRYIPNFYGRTRFSSFFRRNEDVEDGWTSEDVSGRSSPQPTYEDQEVEDDRPVIPPVPVRSEAVPVPLLVRRETLSAPAHVPVPPAPPAPLADRREEGAVSKETPTPARSAEPVSLTGAETHGAAAHPAPVGFAEQIRNQQARMKLRSSSAGLQDPKK